MPGWGEHRLFGRKLRRRDHDASGYVWVPFWGLGLIMFEAIKEKHQEAMDRFEEERGKKILQWFGSEHRKKYTSMWNTADP